MNRFGFQHTRHSEIACPACGTDSSVGCLEAYPEEAKPPRKTSPNGAPRKICPECGDAPAVIGGVFVEHGPKYRRCRASGSAP